MIAISIMTQNIHIRKLRKKLYTKRIERMGGSLIV